MKNISFIILLLIFTINSARIYSEEKKSSFSIFPEDVVNIISDTSVSAKKKLVIIQLATKYELSFNSDQNQIMINYVLSTFFDNKVKLDDKKHLMNFARSCNILFDSKELTDKIGAMMQLPLDLRILFFNTLYVGGGMTHKFYDFLAKEIINLKSDVGSKFFIIGFLEIAPYPKKDVDIVIKKNNGFFDNNLFLNYLNSLEIEDDALFDKRCLLTISEIFLTSDLLLIKAESKTTKKLFDFYTFLLELEDFNAKLPIQIVNKRLKLFTQTSDVNAIEGYLKQLCTDQGRLVEMNYIESKKYNLFSSFLKSKSKTISSNAVKALNAYFDYLEIKHPSSSDPLNDWIKFITSDAIIKEMEPEKDQNSKK